MAGSEASTKYQVRAVSAAFKILGGLAETPRQTLSQLSSSLAMSNSLTYRMLATLEGEGMVYRDRHRRYSLGSRAMYLGYQAQRGLPINEVAQPAIERLVDATAETVHLVLRVGLERVIVATKESPQPVRVASLIGTKFPLYYGGTGLCIFAHLPSELQDDVLAQELAPKTPLMERDRGKIRELAQLVKERGYHVAIGDFAKDAFSVAAPVFGTDGDVIGAICVVGPDSRLTPEVQERAVQAVKAAARDISAALGYAGTQ